jgi:predicted nucleotidyltransferase
MTTVTAEQVVTDTVEAANAVFGREVQAIYTLGSLAHGGFSPLVSDIDVAIVLDQTDAGTAARIAAVQERVLERASSPLSGRLSIFWGDWRAVRTGEGEYLRLGPVDRLDLLVSGRLRQGRDEREPSVRPSDRELVGMCVEFMLGKFTAAYLEELSATEALVASGPRAASKAVLFPVRFLYTLGHGGIGLNEASARWYADADLPGAALALKALEWRSEGIEDADNAVQMLDAELAILHAECLTQYAKHLEELGETTRAAALAERAGHAQVAVPDGH